MTWNETNLSIVFSERNLQHIWSVAGEDVERWRYIYDTPRTGDRFAILDCATCFSAFAYEFSIARCYVSSKASDGDDKTGRLRRRLRELLTAANSPDRVCKLDEAVSELKEKFTHHLAPSLVSKVAHFMYPEVWVPFDSFTEAGLKRLGKRCRDKDGRVSLSHYQGACQHLRDKMPDELGSILLSTLPKGVLQTKMLDLMLMASGGRFDENFLGLPARASKQMVCAEHYS